jgi:hypothetical protein
MAREGSVIGPQHESHNVAESKIDLTELAMLRALFSTKEQRIHDAAELKRLSSRWEGDVLRNIKHRAFNTSLSSRSRKHWQRLYWQMRLGLVKLPTR